MWMKIGWAILLGIMIIWLFPRAKHMLKHSPKGDSSDWRSAILPLIGVVLFVILLIAIV